jgi:hypothetical protein
MIPDTLASQEDTVENKVYPAKTYRLDFINKRVIGKIDGTDAVFQYIKKVFSIDKYAYSIYNWYYGNELFTLRRMPYEYAVVEAPRIVEETLLVDDRILSIDDYTFKQVSVDSMFMSFMVHTIYGTFRYTQEVPV